MVAILEKTYTHSKLKLALAILTSPRAAFEEILARRLLGTALALVALTGAVSVIGAIARASAVGPVQYFALGKDNPLTWVGLYMLYALGLQKLLKWIGTKADYQGLLMVLGWSHVLLLIHQVAGTAWSIASATGMLTPVSSQFLDALRLGLPLWYVVVVAVGIHVMCQVPFSRGVMSYFVIATAATIAFDLTYGRAKMTPFANALPGVGLTAFRLTPMYPDPWLTAPDQIPRLAAAALGLILGLFVLGKSLGWDVGAARRRAASMGLAAVVLFAGYAYSIWKTDYYGKLLSAQRLYGTDKFEQAGRQLEALLPIVKNNAGLILDIADVYYLAGNGEQSIRYYGKFADIVRDAQLTEERDKALSRSYSGIGAVYDIQGKHDLALKQFEKAADAWPEFRDSWVRMAVTHCRMGDYQKAIETGNHAVKKLESEATVPWVALLEAFAQTGDLKQAKAAMEMVSGLDDELAERIGAKPEDWKSAVSKLTPSDLKFPLEREPVPIPRQPGQAKPERDQAKEGTNKPGG